MSTNLATNRNRALESLLGALEHRRGELENLLPPDLPFDRFYATIHQALRQYPALLDCDGKSLLNACVKAAYDGVRIDGREGVITVDEHTFNKNTPNERKVKMARYMPMAFGLIQQIYRGGEVISMYADVIRENDEYRVQRGTNAGIHHIPKLDGPRGSIVAAYSVATLKSGHVVFEVVDGADLAEIRSAAATDKVWKRWTGEMSKKSAVRRHRKTLPLGAGRDIVIRDSEAEELYPDMQRQGAGELPAPQEQRGNSRPTRAAIASRMGTEGGAPLDLADDGPVLEHAQRSDPKDARTKRDPAGDAKTAGADAKTKRDDPPSDLPEDEEAWRVWSSTTIDKIVDAKTADEVQAIAAEEYQRIAAANDDRRDYIRGLISDRLTDFATGEGE